MPEVNTPAVTRLPAATAVKERIAQSGIVAVLRARDAKHFVQVAQALVEIGITAIEVTLTTENALAALAAIRSDQPGEVTVGAGSVLDERDVAACIEAGADFLVAPTLVPDVVRAGLAASTPVYPGALTPNEFVIAARSGADLIKLFPAGVMGPGYLKDLKGPLPALDVMPTGGIRLDDVPAWLAAGALAVGLGGPMLGDAVEGGSINALRRRAGMALDAVYTARAGR